MAVITFSDPVAVEAALLEDHLVPPPAPPGIGTGATADLRRAMARFAGPDIHPERRRAVDRAVERLWRFPFAVDAARRTTAILADHTDGDLDVTVDLGFVVPVHTVAAALGRPEDELGEVLTDVAAVVEVVGRHRPSSPVSNAATRRLLDRFGEDDPVAAASLLCQARDATAALLTSTLRAAVHGTPRRSAVAATTRMVTAPVTIGEIGLEAGAMLILDLGASGHEFGVGPHACPGRSIAERIVAGMMTAIDRR